MVYKNIKINIFKIKIIADKFIERHILPLHITGH